MEDLSGAVDVREYFRSSLSILVELFRAQLLKLEPQNLYLSRDR